MVLCVVGGFGYLDRVILLNLVLFAFVQLLTTHSFFHSHLPLLNGTAIPNSPPIIQNAPPSGSPSRSLENTLSKTSAFKRMNQYEENFEVDTDDNGLMERRAEMKEDIDLKVTEVGILSVLLI